MMMTVVSLLYLSCTVLCFVRQTRTVTVVPLYILVVIYPLPYQRLNDNGAHTHIGQVNLAKQTSCWLSRQSMGASADSSTAIAVTE